MSPFFSPDGAWVGFWSGGKLRKVPIAGGPVVPLCDTQEIFGVSWSPDGTIVFGKQQGGLLWIPEDGGVPERLTHMEEERSNVSHRLPWVMPDGGAVLFTAVEGLDWENAQIVVQVLGTGEPQVLIEGGAHPVYASSGHLVYAKLGDLWAVPFDAKRLEVTGAPSPVVPHVVQTGRLGFTNETGSAQYAISAAGTLVYVPGDLEQIAPPALVWVARDGRSEPLPLEPGLIRNPRIAPEGDRIAFSDQSGEGRVLVYDLERGVSQQLPGAGVNVGAWSPDGSRIVFGRISDGPRNLVVQLADGSAPAERLTTSASHQFANSWSSDGSEILLTESRDVLNSDILVLSMDDPSASPKPLLAEAFSEGHPTLSPDGRWLAYASNESGRYEVHIRSYPDLGQKLQLSSGGGEMPAWSAAGDELFYMTRAPNEEALDVMLAVSLVWQPRVRAGTPRELFRGRFRWSSNIRSYDVSRDGRFLMLTRPKREAVTQSPRIVLNWFEELERLVPTKN